MELVASARLRRAQLRIEAMRPYADRMGELMAGTAQAAGAVRLPLLERRETVKTVAIVPITGDRGLAGAFNAQVLRRSFAEMREAQAAGRRCASSPRARRRSRPCASGASSLRSRGRASPTSPRYSDAQAIAHALAEAYVNGRGRPRDPRLQRVRLAARPEGDRERGAPDPDRRARGRGRRQAQPPGRLLLRARAAPDPRAAAAGVRRDRALPGAARVGGLGAGRADDRDAERLEGRRRADRQPHPRR